MSEPLSDEEILGLPKREGRFVDGTQQFIQERIAEVINAAKATAAGAQREADTQHMASDYNGGEYDWSCRCGAVGHWKDGCLDSWDNHIRNLPLADAEAEKWLREHDAELEANAVSAAAAARNAIQEDYLRLFTKFHKLQQEVTHQLAEARAELEALKKLLNTPEIEDFDKAVPLEAAHQVQRWGAAHDDGKAPENWFWLLGYLGGKALAAAKAGDIDKAKHHCISSAAALRNWHAHLRAGFSVMRPGIAEPAEAASQPGKGGEDGEKVATK